MKRCLRALVCSGLVASLVVGCEEDFVIPGLVNLSASPTGPYTSEQTVTLSVTLDPEIESLGIARVEFYEQGEQPLCADTAAPFSCDWRVTGADNGTHAWIARAYAVDGKNWRSVSMDLTVSIAGGPREASLPGDAFGLIGTIPQLCEARDVAFDAAKELAYVASPNWGLAVIDLSDPSAPTMLAGASQPFNGDHISFDGNIAVVTQSVLEPGDDFAFVVDVSDPYQPITLAKLEGTFRDVAVRGNYAYLSELTPGVPSRQELTVLDLGVPASPRVAGSLAISADRVEVANNSLYASVGQDVALLDISTPTAPRLEDTLTAEEAAQAGFTFSDATGSTLVRCEPALSYRVAVDGSIGVISRGLHIEVVDLADPSSPVVMGHRTANAFELAIQGSYAYSLELVPGRYPAVPELVVTDLRSPATPTVSGRVTIPGTLTNGGTFEMAVGGSFVYVGATSTGLQVIDVSNPSAPRLRGSLSLPESPTRVVAGAGRVYISLSTQLVIADVTNPDAPRTLSTFPNALRVLAVSGTLVYGQVLSSFNGLPTFVVMDFASPVSPRAVGSMSYIPGLSGTIGSTISAALQANRIALVQVKSQGDPRGLVRILDVSDPAHPTYVEDIYLPGYSREIAAANGLLYAADDIASVSIVRPSPSD